jgi:hypothetical protein
MPVLRLSTYNAANSRRTIVTPPTTMDSNFLTERFKAFGFEFQNWMVLVAVVLVLYAVYISFKERNGGSR